MLEKDIKKYDIKKCKENLENIVYVNSIIS